jgi:hypothetical protein
MASEPEANPEPNLTPAGSPTSPLASDVAPSVNINTAAATKPKLVIKPPPKKKWNPPAPSSPLSKLAWKLVFGGTILAMLLLGVIIILLIQTNTPKPDGPPQLADEFRDTVNNSYAIRPPVNWTLQDPHDGRNFFIKGPRETGYIPLMTLCVDVAAGRLDSYLKEYKGRLQAQDPSIQFLEESTLKIDNFETVRLVYTWTSPNDNNTVTKVKTLQYIVCDAPRFYRIGGSVREDIFDKYYPRFDASLKTFRVLPLPNVDKFSVPSF